VIVIPKVLVVPNQDAETGTGTLLATGPAVATKVAEVCPAGMVTERGTVSPLPEERRTVAAVTDRGLVILTVQVVVPSATTVEGEQVKPAKPIAGDTEILVVLVAPFQVAERFPEENNETETAVAVKAADEDPAGIAIELGTPVRIAGEASASATEVAAAGAPVRLTVQVVAPKETSEDGEQLMPDSVIEGVTVTLVVLVSPRHVADTVALESTETSPAVAGN
jgi:hypothetical protein